MSELTPDSNLNQESLNMIPVPIEKIPKEKPTHGVNQESKVFTKQTFAHAELSIDAYRFANASITGNISEKPDPNPEKTATLFKMSDSEDSEYQPKSKSRNGPYNRSAKHQRKRGKGNSEYQPDSIARQHSSEYSVQYQIENQDLSHKLSSATPDNASDNLSSHLDLPEVIVISSDDENSTQNRRNGVGQRNETNLPQTNNEVGLSAESRRGSENYELGGEELPTYPIVHTQSSNSPVRYQRGATSLRTKLSSYSIQLRIGWEDSETEDRNNEPGDMIKDSAQRRREANSGYRLETMSPLSQTRGQSPDYFLNRSGRDGNSDYQFELPNSHPDRRQKGNFESQFRAMSSFPNPNRRDGNSDYRFEPLTSSVQSTEYQPELIPRIGVPDHSKNRREESYPELNDWNSLYDEDIEGNEESERFNPGETFHVQNSGIKDPAHVGGNDEVRRRVRERLGLAVSKNTAESHSVDDNQRSEEDAKKCRYKCTSYMRIEGERVHRSLGQETKAFNDFLLQEADIKSDNGI
ncbi:hypothetical protein BOTCAL_0070g00140 [Botryotinia calthae]|uniref:Uncharacterized protein n=1 Tax=Botryotinia calthae TaxID=38488 RepID=A0A4Y8DBI7_9HELO|nr:hypothetical protein BOTCAL_0070g00140 [Botryotinia calthae]